MIAIKSISVSFFNAFSEGLSNSWVAFLVTFVAKRYFPIFVAPIGGVAAGMFLVGFSFSLLHHYKPEFAKRFSAFCCDYLKDDYWINLALIVSVVVMSSISVVAAFVLGLALGVVGTLPINYGERIHRMSANTKNPAYTKQPH